MATRIFGWLGQFGIFLMRFGTVVAPFVAVWVGNCFLSFRQNWITPIKEGMGTSTTSTMDEKEERFLSFLIDNFEELRTVKRKVLLKQILAKTLKEQELSAVTAVLNKMMANCPQWQRVQQKMRKMKTKNGVYQTLYK